MDFVLHNFLTKKEERRDEIGSKWRKRRTHENGRKYFTLGHSCIQEEEKREGSERKYLAKENIFLAEKKKNPEGIEGK